VLGLVVGSFVPGLQRGAARPRAGGGEGESDGEVAADGGAERARGLDAEWPLIRCPTSLLCSLAHCAAPPSVHVHAVSVATVSVVMAHAGASWRTPANQSAPAPARQAAAAPDLVEKVTARAHHRVMTDMESRYSRENGRLPSRLLPCEFFDNSITAMVRQLLAAKGKNQLSRTKDIELHYFYNPASSEVPQAELQFMVIFDKGPGMNKEEITGWAEMAHKTSDRVDSKIIRDADKV
jgi:hypothetical protein